MICGAPDMCRNTELVTYVDNQGSCDIWKKGFSTSCLYSYTIVNALNEEARGLNCRVHVQKITRCSDTWALAADALSKADFKLFWNLMPDHNTSMEKVPKAVIKWLMDPTIDMELGTKILQEMASSHQVLN